MKRHPSSIRLPVELHERMIDYCHVVGITATSFIEQLVERGLSTALIEAPDDVRAAMDAVSRLRRRKPSSRARLVALARGQGATRTPQDARSA